MLRVLFLLLPWSNGELIFTHVLYRHGDRTPVATYPNDPYQEDAWPNGFKQLTQKGCQQQHELGEYLRRTYGGFLDESYNAAQIYVRSTDYDRTLASAACNLAGLFPPAGSQVWNSEIKWQPVPIHTVSVENDYLLKVGHECPAFDAMLKDAHDRFVANLYKGYDTFFQFLKNVTGVKVVDSASVKRIATALQLEASAGFDLPAWTQQVWLDPNDLQTKTALQLVTQLRVSKASSLGNIPDESWVHSGILVGTIVNNMKSKLADENSRPTKMVMYSAHDGTLVALMQALNIFDGITPPFAACLMIELHTTAMGNNSVRILYRTDPNKEPLLLTIPECSSWCPLEKFEQLLDKVAFYDEEQRRMTCNID
uniref:acid phosphatase n=1 Tax=Trichuris muris TaxID=70415 RepID=A0A5S6QWF5_TRIMR